MTKIIYKGDTLKEFWSVYEDRDEIIYITDIDTYEIIYMNQCAREIYDVSNLEELRGKKCYELLWNSADACAMCTNSKIVNGEVYEWNHFNQNLHKYMYLKDQMILHEGRRLKVSFAKEVIDQTDTYRYDGIDEMSNIINECLRMALEKTDSEQGIQCLIEYLGHVLSGERVYIFELSEDQTVWNNTYEWCAYQVTPQKHTLQNIPYETTKLWIREFEKNRFVAIGDIEQIRETDSDVYHYLLPQNIHSIIVGPLYINDRLGGFFGIDNPPVEKLNQVLSMLKTIGHVIDTMIVKRGLVHRLEQMSYQDSMTGIGNRHAIKRYFESLDRSQSIGMIFCDVCGLKNVNDTKGHAVGDKLIMDCCDSLRTEFSENGIFRIGGDEFLVIASGMSEEEFIQKYQNLRRLNQEKKITVSVGKIWEESIRKEMNILIALSDEDMYKDKREYYRFQNLERVKSYVNSEKKKIILIADDSEIDVEILNVIFDGQYEILNAFSGQEAWKIISDYRDRLSIILLDLVMPEMSGFEVLDRMYHEKLIEQIPVIVITGDIAVQSDLKSYEYGAADIIHKPFSAEVVLRRTKNLIEQYEVRQKMLKLLELKTGDLQQKTKELEVSRRKLEKNNEFLINALSSVIGYRSTESGEHINRVKTFTSILLKHWRQIYPEDSFTDNDIQLIVNASAIHDIGKIAIPDHILNKPARLTDEEYEIVKTHTTLGCEILQNFKQEDMDFYKYCYDICRYHHERYDGKGYPDGLSGNEIPIWAQIVSIVDVYDALTSKRVYKEAYTFERAVWMIFEGQCGEFSPKLLNCFTHAKGEIRRATIDMRG